MNSIHWKNKTKDTNNNPMYRIKELGN